MKDKSLARMTAFLRQLDDSKIAYSLAHHRDESVMVTVSVPGERWEIEFLEDGTVEVERFRSSGEIDDEHALDELFLNFSDAEKRTGKRSTVSSDQAKTARRMQSKAGKAVS